VKDIDEDRLPKHSDEGSDRLGSTADGPGGKRSWPGQGLDRQVSAEHEGRLTRSRSWDRVQQLAQACQRRTPDPGVDHIRLTPGDGRGDHGLGSAQN
jgi:hypothetical protein